MKLRKVGFVVDKVALGRVYLRVLQFPSVNIIPPLLHRHFTDCHSNYICVMS